MFWNGVNNYGNAPKDGSAWIDSPARGADRVLRGGCCFVDAEDCRPADRSGLEPDGRSGNIGFRLVLPPALFLEAV